MMCGRSEQLLVIFYDHTEDLGVLGLGFEHWVATPFDLH